MSVPTVTQRCNRNDPEWNWKSLSLYTYRKLNHVPIKEQMGTQYGSGPDFIFLKEYETLNKLSHKVRRRAMTSKPSPHSEVEQSVGFQVGFAVASSVRLWQCPIGLFELC